MDLDQQQIKDKLENGITDFVSRPSWGLDGGRELTFFAELGQILQSSRGLLAGGSILGAIHDRPIKDLDIYVHCSGVQAIDAFLKSQDLQVAGPADKQASWGTFSSLGEVYASEVNAVAFGAVTTAPAYDQSFFRKNHILARIPYYSLGTDVDKKRHQVDLMIISNDTDPHTVVTNFDLTFCEVWWDGQDVNATDMPGVLGKRGRLRDEYTESLVKYFNPFIVDRMNKYRNRGYEIRYNCPEGVINIEKSAKTVQDPDEWVFKFLYGVVLSMVLPDNQPDFLCTYPLVEEPTILELGHLVTGYMATLDPPAAGADIMQLYLALLCTTVPSEWTGVNGATYSGYFDSVLGLTIDAIEGASQPLVDQIYRARVRSLRARIAEYEYEYPDTDDDDEPLSAEAVAAIEVARLAPEDIQTIQVNEAEIPQECKDLLMFADEPISDFLRQDDASNLILVLAAPTNGRVDEIDDNATLCYDLDYMYAALNNIQDEWFYECTGDFLPIIPGDVLTAEYGGELYDASVAAVYGDWPAASYDLVYLIPAEDPVTRQPIVDPETGEAQVRQVREDRVTAARIRHPNNRAMSTFGDTPYIGVAMNETGQKGFVPAGQLKTLIEDVENRRCRVFYLLPHIGADGAQTMITHTATYKNAFRVRPDYVSSNHCQSGSAILLYDLYRCTGECAISDGIGTGPLEPAAPLPVSTLFMSKYAAPQPTYVSGAEAAQLMAEATAMKAHQKVVDALHSAEESGDPDRIATAQFAYTEYIREVEAKRMARVERERVDNELNSAMESGDPDRMEAAQSAYDDFYNMDMDNLFERHVPNDDERVENELNSAIESGDPDRIAAARLAYEEHYRIYSRLE